MQASDRGYHLLRLSEVADVVESRLETSLAMEEIWVMLVEKLL